MALAGFLLWPGLLLGGILAWQRKKLSGHIKLALLAVMLLFTFVGATGCATGIHMNSTPVGTHTLSITANASSSASSGANDHHENGKRSR